MRSGSPILFDVALFDATGAGLSYANQAAFLAASWGLSWIDMATGAAASPSVSWTIAPVAGVTGRHVIQVAALPAQELFLRITPPSTAHSWMVLPGAVWTGEATDTDQIYARINSIYGVSSATTPPSLTLSPMVEADAYACTISIPTSYLARLGWTDLTGTTLTGTVRRPADDGTGTAAADLVTGAPTAAQGKIAINGTTPTNIDITWDSYPTGMVLTTPERAAGGVAFRVSIEATKAGKQLTVLYRGTLQISAKDNPT